MDMRRKDLETFVALSEGTGPDHFLVPIGIMQELAEHLAASDDDPGGRPQEANRLREALLSSGREPAEPPNPYGPRVEIPQQLLHEAVQHLGSADNDLGSRPIEAARLREALLAEVAVPEGSPFQDVVRQIREILVAVETRWEKTLRDLAAGLAQDPKPIAHLMRNGESLCGIPAERLTSGIGLGVVEWLDMDAEKDGPFCKRCAMAYRTARLDDRKRCTRCHGEAREEKCPQCAGVGSYPRWAAEALEAERPENADLHELGWRPLAKWSRQRCAALDTAGERCPNRARWVGQYHGDPEIYDRETPPRWVEVDVCDAHVTHGKKGE